MRFNALLESCRMRGNPADAVSSESLEDTEFRIGTAMRTGHWQAIVPPDIGLAPMLRAPILACSFRVPCRRHAAVQCGGLQYSMFMASETRPSPNVAWAIRALPARGEISRRNQGQRRALSEYRRIVRHARARCRQGMQCCRDTRSCTSHSSVSRPTANQGRCIARRRAGMQRADPQAGRGRERHSLRASITHHRREVWRAIQDGDWRPGVKVECT